MATVLEKPKVKNEATIGWLKQALHRARNEVFTEVKTVTPQMAEVMLEYNNDNRPIRPMKLTQMATDMREGRWTFNGEPLIFSDTGELNDGQHRLTALRQAGVPVSMLFVFGVERESRITVDQGAARSPGDYLLMENVPDARTAASIARQLIAYERAGKESLGRTGDITASQVVERATTDRGIATSAKYGQHHNARMKHMAAVSVVGFCHYVFLNKNVDDGLAFMEQLCTGENLLRTDPAFKARERLLRLEQRSRAVQTEIIFRAWNAYRERRTLTTIPVMGRLPEVK